MSSIKLIFCGFVVLMAIAEVCFSVENHRLGRYTLESSTPSRAQTDLLSATVKTKFPSQIATVGQAIDYLLQRSGYRLKVTEDFRSTLNLPLPHVHRKIGPLDLRSALKTLTGGVWGLQENSRDRVVWFQQSSSASKFPNSIASSNLNGSNQENFHTKVDSLTVNTAEFKVVWTLLPHQTLRSNIMRWAEKENWTVEWNSRHDYDIYHQSNYQGTFFEAVRTVLQHYERAPVPLTASFYTGNSVLVIEPYHARSQTP